MKKSSILLILFSVFWFSAMVFSYTPPASSRVSFNFNHDWKFLKTNLTTTMGYEAASYNDSSWQDVSLPHTFNDVDKFREWISTRNDTPIGSIYYGKAWYRKHFKLDAAYAGKKVFLEFEGIRNAADFYINGNYVTTYRMAVTPCGVDISQYVNFGATENVLAVWVDNNNNYKYDGTNSLPFAEAYNPNFGGIQKDVTIHIMDKIYQTLPLYENLGTVGTYIYATNIDTSNKKAVVSVETEIKNEYSAGLSVSFDAVIVDRASNSVLTLSSPSQTINAGQKAILKASGNMTGIHFWAPDYPYLYQVYSIVKTNGVVADVVQTTTGFRKISFTPAKGLKINGHPVFLDGYAPRTSMEWPCVGIPPDWMTEYDFNMMRDSGANFVRPMHSAPRKSQVEAADKFGIVMVCPAACTENQPALDNPGAIADWGFRTNVMRDCTVYFRNNPSLFFYEGVNGDLTPQEMTDMKSIKQAWDPYGGRLSGTRASGEDGIREYGSSMDGVDPSPIIPIWDAEYARGECPRRVWDKYSPMLNPKYNGSNDKYLYGGYLAIASDYHKTETANNTGEGIYDYLNGGQGYFRLTTMEDLVVENLAKFWGRLMRSAFVLPFDDRTNSGVMVGGAKIIWADSVTDGRMRDCEVARVSGAVDGARLPKEVFNGFQVVHNPNPQAFILGHWNYPANTVKSVYVAANCDSVRLRTYNTSGGLIKDYGLGTKSIMEDQNDQYNNYVFGFSNVAWQAGKVQAIGYKGSAAVCTNEIATVGNPYRIKLTPIYGPDGFRADGNDIVMIDVEVVDQNGFRCPTDEDRVDFTYSGSGATYLGGYNSGKRYSTFSNFINTECGINRIFARATRTAGSFIINATRTGLQAGSLTITSAAFNVNNGLTAVFPKKYTVALGNEPAAVEDDTNISAGPTPPPTDTTSVIVKFAYTGSPGSIFNPVLPDAHIVHNAANGMQVYGDISATFQNLPSYLIGGDYIQAFQRDAGESSSTDLYQFYMNKFGYIYQLVDASNSMPDHNNNASYQWQLMPETTVINGRTHKIYKSRLMSPEELGYLACNGKNITLAPNCNLYVVFAVSAESELEKPTMPITCSSFETANPAVNAFDANATTRWGASDGTYPQWIKIDLGAKRSIGGFEINWLNAFTRSYKYKIELSDDDLSYSLAIDKLNNTIPEISEDRISGLNVNAGRFVKLTVTGGGGWASLYDMKIFGVNTNAVSSTPASSSSSIIVSSSVSSTPVSSSSSSSGASNLLSQGKPATASTFQAGNVISNANDGSLTTRWTASDGTFPQWWSVDLGASYALAKVDVSWYASATRSYKYKIETSTDGSTYTTIVDKTANTAVGDTSDNCPVSARFVRITINGASAGWASFYEVKVYGANGSSSISSVTTSSAISSSSSSIIPVSSSSAGSSVSGIKVEAQTFTATNGVQMETCSEGGQDASYIDKNDWLDFSVNIPAAGTYAVVFRTSSPYTGTSLSLMEGTTVLASAININTGGYQTWGDNPGSSTFALTAGTHTLRIFANSNGFNFHYFILNQQ